MHVYVELGERKEKSNLSRKRNNGKKVIKEKRQKKKDKRTVHQIHKSSIIVVYMHDTTSVVIDIRGDNYE
jgi:hypothetical protein